jgi:uncharacterized protein YprB with RNaseH-like and TPR domain
MIIRQNVISVEEIISEDVIELNGLKEIYKSAIFFDLEHYVYKKPICIGVFGSCYYDDESNSIKVTQYMIENKKDSEEILRMAEEYFKKAYYEDNKRYIVTFSGNNDFTVINYLFDKHKIKLNLEEFFQGIDIQKLYEAVKGVCTGLKTLEKLFCIDRDEKELISGSNLAKTFSKIVKDDKYIQRMPKEKINKILLYNEQDVISLFNMLINWNKFIEKCEEKKD